MARSYFFIVVIILQTIVNNRASVLDLYTKRAASVDESAKLVRSYINESVDPCADYASYICNGPEVLNELTPLEMVISRMADGSRVQKFFLEYEMDLKEEEKLHDFLKSCSTNNRKQIVDVLKENTFFKVLKSWPIFDENWNVEKFDIVQLLGELRMYGFDIGLDVSIKKTPRRDVLLIRPAAIYKDFLIYGKYREKILRSLGIVNPQSISSDAEDFFKEFSKVIPYDDENKTPELETTYGEFKKNFPDFDWDRYFRIFSEMVPDNSLEILVVNPERIKEAIFTIKNMEPRIVVNFIFLQLTIRFNHLIENPRHTCYDYAFFIFKPIISRILVDKYYNDEFRETFLGTMDILLKAIEEDFHLFQIPHDVAMEKLDKIINEEFLSSLTATHSNQRLKEWNVEEDNFYGNVWSFHPRVSKEVMQNFLKTKGLDKRILNADFISYLITKSLFDFEKQPAVLQYDSIAAPVIIEVIVWLKNGGAKEFEENISKGAAKETFSTLTNTSIESEFFLQSNQYYLDLYLKWAQNNQDVIKKEDEIFKSYGLNSMKILFSAMRNICPVRELLSENMQNVAQRLANSDAFMKEYNCPVGDAINYTE